MEELDNSIQLKGQIQQIYSVLIKQEHDKMPFQGIQIAKTIIKIPFFKKYFDASSEPFINLCINQDAVQLQQGTVVYNQEKFQRYIYIILEGEVEIKTSGKVRKLGIFRVFGQVQVAFKLKDRLEEAIVTKNAKVMRIKQSSFCKVFTMRQEIVKCLHYLNVNEYFQPLNHLEKMQLALCLTKIHYEPGQIIKKEGQKFDKVLFFIYGRVDVITKIFIKGKEQEYIIDKLDQMSNFGQYQSTQKINTDVKLKAIVTGGYYCMRHAELVKQEHEIINIIKRKAIPYPNAQEMAFLEEIKREVKKQENKIMKKYLK